MNGTDVIVSVMEATDTSPVEVLPPLADIWKCPTITQYGDGNGKNKWSCARCPPGGRIHILQGGMLTKCCGTYVMCQVKGFARAKVSFPRTMYVCTRITTRINHCKIITYK